MGLASAQVTKVRSSNCGFGAFPSTVCTIGPTGSGNLIVVAFATGVANAQVSSVSDNAGNLYEQVVNSSSVNTAGYSALVFWYAKNSKSGATSLTITPSPSGTGGIAVIWEFANVDTVAPLESVATLNSRPSTSTPSGAAVTTAGNSLIISAVLSTSPITGIVAGNPFTNDSNLYGEGFAHMVASAAGTYSAQWNSGGGTYNSSTVSFKAKSGTTAPPPPPTALNSCDLKVDGVVNGEDVNTAVSMTLGQSPCTANILGTGVCNVLVVQRVVNAMNGGACVVGNPHSVTLNWVASVSTGVTGYNVYRSTTSGSGYQQINTTTVTGVTYADNIVQAGLTYYYVVKARDAAGNESGPSNEATAVIPMP